MIDQTDEISWGYLIDPCFQLVNTKGVPLTGGYLEVYIHGTRDKYYCASDFDGTLQPFQIPLDSLGSNIVLAEIGKSYDVYVYNRFGSLVMSRYNVAPGKGGGGSNVSVTSSDGTVDVDVEGTVYDLSVQDIYDSVDELRVDLDNLASGLVPVYFRGQGGGYTEINFDPSGSGEPVTTSFVSFNKKDGNLDLGYHSSLPLPEGMWAWSATLKFTSLDDVNITMPYNITVKNSAQDPDFVHPYSGDLDLTYDNVQSVDLTGLVRGEGDFQIFVSLGPAYDGTVRVELDRIYVWQVRGMVGDGGSGNYEAGWGIEIDDDTISVDPTVIQAKLTAGSGIYIDPITNVVSATNEIEIITTQTTYQEICDIVDSGKIPILKLDENAVGQTGNFAYEMLTADFRDSQKFLFGRIENQDYEAGVIYFSGHICYGNRPYYWSGYGRFIATTDMVHDYTAGSYISIDNDMISVTGIDPNSYATHIEVDTKIVSAVDVVTGMIPEVQVQSDWTETDTSDPSYIQNKPELAPVATSGSYNDLYDTPDLSAYTTEADVHNIIASSVSGGDSFYAEVHVTPYSEIKAAYDAGYTIFAVQHTETSDKIYTLEYHVDQIAGGGSEFKFTNIDGGTLYTAHCYSQPAGHSSTGWNTDSPIYIPAAQVQTDWNATWGMASILNKPDLSVYTTETDVQNMIASSVTGGVEIGYQNNGVLDLSYDGIKLVKNESDNTNIGLRKNGTWLNFGGLVPLSAGSNKYLTTDNTGKITWDIKPDLSDYTTEIDVHNIIASSVTGGPEYTAGDNIVISGEEISLSDVVSIDARNTAATGNIRLGNITHWVDQDYGVGIEIDSLTSEQYQGGQTQFMWFVNSDMAHSEYAWGRYEHDRETEGVSGEKVMYLGEGDITYKEGTFQSTDTLPVIWSCSQMATDIEALKAASGGGSTYTAGDNIDISNDVISVTGTGELLAGDNISITASGDNYVISSTGGGSSYSAGSGIDIINNTISVKSGSGLYTDANDTLRVKTGTGIYIDANGGIAATAASVETIVIDYGQMTAANTTLFDTVFDALEDGKRVLFTEWNNASNRDTAVGAATDWTDTAPYSITFKMQYYSGTYLNTDTVVWTRGSAATRSSSSARFNFQNAGNGLQTTSASNGTMSVKLGSGLYFDSNNAVAAYGGGSASLPISGVNGDYTAQYGVDSTVLDYNLPSVGGGEPEHLTNTIQPGSISISNSYDGDVTNSSVFICSDYIEFKLNDNTYATVDPASIGNWNDAIVAAQIASAAVVSALPANPISDVLYLIPEA